MAKKFFIEITDPEKNVTHVSEFDQGKVFNSIEACQTFLDNNFIVDDKDDFVVRHWETDQRSNTNTNKKSYLGTHGRQSIELQKGINIYLPYENNDQNPVSVSNWVVRTGSGPTISDKLKNKHIVLKNNKALVDWTDKMVHDLRPEAVLRLYALRGQYPVLENLEDNNNDIRGLDNLQSVWEDQKEITEYRFFVEGKKGVEIHETKTKTGWFVKPLVTKEEFKTTCKIKKVLDKNRVKNITIPSAINGKPVESIRKYAFEKCVNLENIVIPNSVTSIEEEAFKNCTSLKEIAIPNSIISVEYRVFKNCTRLTNVNIPNSVTSIGENSFENCTGLTNVNIPNSVASIGKYAFSDCTGLTKINIPNSVTSIEKGAFSGCTGLTNVNIPNSVASIGDAMFYRCTNLTNVNIPNSVTSIENSAFYGCTNLNNVIIPNSVTSIGKWAFACCGVLKNIHIPNSVTSLGIGTFKNCIALKKITIPDSLTSIECGMFESCMSLDNIVISKFVTSIENRAFRNCINLKSVVVNSVIPPSLERDVFVKNVPGKRIFVPKDSLDNYKQVWSDFKDDIFPVE